MNRLQLKIVIFILAILGGCAGISNDRYSRARPVVSPLPTVNERFVGEMYVTGDIAFHIFPLNAKSSSLAIFPLPHRFAEQPEAGSPFSIGLALKTSKSGYSFNPAAVRYWMDQATQIAPARIQGPFDCGSTKRRPPMQLLTIEAIPLRPHSCNYMWMEFDVVTPDPAQTFYVALSMRFDEQDIALPVIEFQEETGKSSFAIP